MCKTIALCNQKGGVGKTTTAINLGACLALKNKKVLIIDFDPQGNSTSGLGIDKKALKASIYSIITENEYNFDEIIKQTCVTGLDIIPSNIDLTGAEIELVSAIARENKLKNAIQPLKEKYDYIFIDSPPSLGLLTLNALVSSDSIIIPLQCEYYALEGLSQLLNTLNLVKKNLNPKLEIEGVLLTMADKRTNLTGEVIKEVKDFFRDKVYDTIIPRNIKLSEAPGFGKPVIAYDNLSLGAVKYAQLADEFLSKNESHGNKSENVLVSKKEPQDELESVPIDLTVSGEESQ